MKKLNYILLGAAALAMASCSQEEVAAPSAEGVPFTIKLPADQATRALSDGLTADDLWIAIYDASTGNNLVDQVKAEFGNSLETTVYLNLANGKTYNIAFFACSTAAATDGVYNFHAGDKMLYVNYDNMKSASNLADAYDCFYNLHNTGKISTETATPVTVTLYRPVAQINWGTSDYDEAAVKDGNAFGENGQYVLTNLTLDAYTQFDLFTKDVTGKATPQTISAFAAPVNEVFPVYEPKDILNSAGEVVGEENLYQYVAMQYVLAPKEVGIFDLDLDINNGGNTNIETGVVTNDVVRVNSAPLQANYRTNIYGALLTNPFEYKVVKDPNWNQPDYDIDLTTWDGTTSTTPQKVNGTYRIVSASDIAGLADMVSGGNTLEGETIVLGADFDMGGKPFDGIGTGVLTNNSDMSGRIFKGTFDGQGHTISNLKVVGKAGQGAGFIGCVGTTGTVKNVNFENIDIQGGDSSGATAVGAIAYVNSGGKVINVNVSSGKVSGWNNVGGVVGQINLSGTVQDCYNGATVNGSWDTAGVVGMSVNGNVSGCVNEGAVTATNNSVGGIIGEQRNGGTVKGNTNKGAVNGVVSSGTYGVGGIVGWIRYYATEGQVGTVVISENTNEANVKGGISTGGVVGRWSMGGTCTGNTNSGNIAGVDGVSGIVGSTARDQYTEGAPEVLTVSGNTATSGTLTADKNAWTIIYVGGIWGSADVTDNTPANAPVN